MPTLKHILLLLFFFPALVQAQLNGTYCHSTLFEYICITFNQDKTFRFNKVSDSDSHKGIGYYEVKDNQVILKFRTDTLNSYLEIEEIPANDQDSIFIDITAFDVITNGRRPANFHLKDKNGTKINIGSTDIKGEYRFVMPLVNDTAIIHFLGYGTRYISREISLDKSYKIKVYYFDNWGGYLYNEDERLSLNIVNSKKLVFEWTFLNETRLYEFKKIKKRRKSN